MPKPAGRAGHEHPANAGDLGDLTIPSIPQLRPVSQEPISCRVIGNIVPLTTNRAVRHNRPTPTPERHVNHDDNRLAAGREPQTSAAGLPRPRIWRGIAHPWASPRAYRHERPVVNGSPRLRFSCPPQSKFPATVSHDPGQIVA
jgi:hypothetical protein